jgi:hypothetical protein
VVKINSKIAIVAKKKIAKKACKNKLKTKLVQDLQNCNKSKHEFTKNKHANPEYSKNNT